MIKIDKGDVHIEGDIIEIMTEFVIGLREVSCITKNNGLGNEELLGAIFTGLYEIKGEKEHQDCYKLGKFIDYKCKEIKKR